MGADLERRSATALCIDGCQAELSGTLGVASGTGLTALGFDLTEINVGRAGTRRHAYGDDEQEQLGHVIDYLVEYGKRLTVASELAVSCDSYDSGSLGQVFWVRSFTSNADSTALRACPEFCVRGIA